MMTATRRSTTRRLLVALLALFGLASTAAAQCPGDPTNGNPATRAAVLALGQTIPAAAADAMQRIVLALEGQGHAAVVMDNNGPSDHKAWIDGDAWTLRSSDPQRCPALTWSPYVQAAYDGSGLSACGIPTSAHLACPPWFTPATPPVGPPVVTPPPPSVTPPLVTPPVDDPRFAALADQIAFVREGLAQLGARVLLLEGRPIYASCSAAINLGMRIPISCKLTP